MRLAGLVMAGGLLVVAMASPPPVVPLGVAAVVLLGVILAEAPGHARDAGSGHRGA
jgi:hypothetical protein